MIQLQLREGKTELAQNNSQSQPSDRITRVFNRSEPDRIIYVLSFFLTVAPKRENSRKNRGVGYRWYIHHSKAKTLEFYKIFFENLHSLMRYDYFYVLHYPLWQLILGDDLNFRKTRKYFLHITGTDDTSTTYNFFIRWDEDIAIIFMLTSDHKLSKNEVSMNLKNWKTRRVLKG